MANPTCSTATLVNDAAQYRLGIITPHHRKALMVYAKLLELAALGGTSYAANHKQLFIDAAQFEVGESDDALQAARVSIAFTNATAAGATVPSDINAKMAQLRMIMYQTDAFLDQIELLLTCQLGVHKAYPQ